MEQLMYRMLLVQLVVSNKKKSVSGDDSALCLNVSHGISYVRNAACTTCSEF